MDVLTGILGAGTAGIAGGLFGVLGGALNRFFDWLTVKEKIKADKAKYDHEAKIIGIETQRDVIIAKEDANARREVAESETLAASYGADRATYLTPGLTAALPPWAQGLIAAALAIVDFVRGLTRPGLTMYLCGLTTLLYFQVHEIVIKAGGAPIPLDQAVGLIRLIIETVCFLTTMAVGWWFASRAKPIEA